MTRVRRSMRSDLATWFVGRTRGQTLSQTCNRFADELLLDVGALRKIRKLLDDKRQVIFSGTTGHG